MLVVFEASVMRQVQDFEMSGYDAAISVCRRLHKRPFLQASFFWNADGTIVESVPGLIEQLMVFEI